MAKQDRSRKSRWGILNDEEMKVVEILSSSEPLIGMQMLKHFPIGPIMMILDKTIFYWTKGDSAGPRQAVRFLVFNSLFKLDIQHLHFDVNCISTKGIWGTMRLDPKEFHTRFSDKDFELVWYVYDYDKHFCENVGIKRISIPV